jgi:hypothetical protein
LRGPPPDEFTSTFDPSLNVAAGFESDGIDVGRYDGGDGDDGDPEPQANSEAAINRGLVQSFLNAVDSDRVI